MLKKRLLVLLLIIFIALAVSKLTFAEEDSPKFDITGTCEYHGLYFYDTPKQDTKGKPVKIMMVDSSGNEVTSNTINQIAQFLEYVDKEVYIYTFTSVEGKSWYNMALAKLRAGYIKSLVKNIDKTSEKINIKTVKTYAVGETDYFAKLDNDEKKDYEKSRKDKSFWHKIPKLVQNRRFIITARPVEYTKKDLSNFHKLTPNTMNADGCPKKPIPPPPVPLTCGNKIIDPGEECDDGNKIDGDGCSKECKLEKKDDCFCPLEFAIKWIEKDPNPCAWSWWVRALACYLPILLLLFIPLPFFRRRKKHLNSDRGALVRPITTCEELKLFLLDVIGIKEQAEDKIRILRQKVGELEGKSLEIFKERLSNPDVAYFYDPTSEQYQALAESTEKHKVAIKAYMDLVHVLLILEEYEKKLFELLHDPLLTSSQCMACNNDQKKAEIIEKLKQEIHTIVKHSEAIKKEIHRETMELGLWLTVLPGLFGKKNREFGNASTTKFDGWLRRQWKKASFPSHTRPGHNRGWLFGRLNNHEVAHNGPRLSHGQARMNDEQSPWYHKLFNRAQGGFFKFKEFDEEGKHNGEEMSWLRGLPLVPHERVHKFKYIGNLDIKIHQDFNNNRPVFEELGKALEDEKFLVHELIEMLGSTRLNIAITNPLLGQKTHEQANEIISETTKFKAKITPGCPPYKVKWIWGNAVHEIKIPEGDNYADVGNRRIITGPTWQDIQAEINNHNPGVSVLDPMFSSGGNGVEYKLKIDVIDNDSHTNTDEKVLTLTEEPDPVKVTKLKPHLDVEVDNIDEAVKIIEDLIDKGDSEKFKSKIKGGWPSYKLNWVWGHESKDEIRLDEEIADKSGETTSKFGWLDFLQKLKK